MQEHFEHRIIKLELNVENQNKELKNLQIISTDFKNSLLAIEKTLTQIKYLTIGAMLAVVSQATGVTNIMKLIIGI